MALVRDWRVHTSDSSFLVGQDAITCNDPRVMAHVSRRGKARYMGCKSALEMDLSSLRLFVRVRHLHIRFIPLFLRVVALRRHGCAASSRSQIFGNVVRVSP